MEKKIIEEIVNQTPIREVFDNWQYWLLLTILLGLIFSIKQYVGPYLTKRGQGLATKEDFNSLNLLLKKQTEDTEKIKIAISHDDWALRENKKIRRQKLEDLIETAQLLIEVFNENYYRILNNESPNYKDLMAKFELLAFLYFPELGEETSALLSAYSNSKVFIATLNQTAFALKAEGKSHIEAFHSTQDDFLKITRELEQLRQELTLSAVKIAPNFLK